MPVIASNAGDIPETKVDLPNVVPVDPTTGKLDSKTRDYICFKK